MAVFIKTKKNTCSPRTRGFSCWHLSLSGARRLVDANNDPAKQWEICSQKRTVKCYTTTKSLSFSSIVFTCTCPESECSGNSPKCIHTRDHLILITILRQILKARRHSMFNSPPGNTRGRRPSNPSSLVPKPPASQGFE